MVQGDDQTAGSAGGAALGLLSGPRLLPSGHRFRRRRAARERRRRVPSHALRPLALPLAAGVVMRALLVLRGFLKVAGLTAPSGWERAGSSPRGVPFRVLLRWSTGVVGSETRRRRPYWEPGRSAVVPACPDGLLPGAFHGQFRVRPARELLHALIRQVEKFGIVGARPMVFHRRVVVPGADAQSVVLCLQHDQGGAAPWVPARRRICAAWPGAAAPARGRGRASGAVLSLDAGQVAQRPRPTVVRGVAVGPGRQQRRVRSVGPGGP